VAVFRADEVLVVERAVRARPGPPVDLLDVEIGLLLGDGDEVEIIDGVVLNPLGRGACPRA